MASADVVVVGGGIAGLSVLSALSRVDPGLRGCLLERESVLGAHASGRNAAIHRPLESDDTTARLVARSRELMGELQPDGFLTPCGLVLVAASADALRPLAEHAGRQDVGIEWLDAHALSQLAPQLGGGDAAHGLRVEGGGVLDIHGMLAGLRASARGAGHEIRTGQDVQRLLTDGDRVAGVELSTGERIDARHVVICAGAWGRQLGAACGCELPLSPVRRHLVQLRPPADVAQVGAPVVWRIDTEVYLRREGGGLLASPCDATPWPAEDPPSDRGVLELLAEKLGALCPGFDRSAVQSYWACLRTFAPDRELVAGPDPRLTGLHWLGGLGGRGMSVGPAAGELVARGIDGQFPPDFNALHPARLL